MTSPFNRSAPVQAPTHRVLARLAAMGAMGASLVLGGCAVVSEGPGSGYPAGYPSGPGVVYPGNPGYHSGTYGGSYSGSSGYYGGAVYGAPGYYPPAAVVVTPRIITPVVPVVPRPSYSAPVIVPPRAMAPVVVTRPVPPSSAPVLQPGYNPRNPGMSAPSFHGGGTTATPPSYRPSPGSSLPASRFGQAHRRTH